jgi:flagellar motor switch protein FliN/FliY
MADDELTEEELNALNEDGDEGLPDEISDNLTEGLGQDFDENDEDSEEDQPEEDEEENIQTHQDLDFILDIPLELSVELGRSRMLVNDLLQLGQGSIIELNKLAGEPLEIYINTKLVARGEVVVVNEKFGVRLTDIITPMERVRSLG